MDDAANEDALSTTVLEADESAVSEAGDYFADEDEPLRGSPNIFTTIHRVRALIIASIEDPYTSTQLTSPRVNTLVVRPLVDRLYDPDETSIGLLASLPPLLVNLASL
ncbi:uncharacterized protein TrAtP1_005604 [Trichoderma atroviride]|uniref:uncharacterized protein n=1 Tax=Hypocrea atroviridis TaxID=63577 RepID=UPI003331C236|nr:hypothetical protein TrAtP1_005604 [Trichoderma atroviride]